MSEGFCEIVMRLLVHFTNAAWRFLEFGIWDLDLPWDLGLGLWSLGFGASPAPF